MIGFLDYVEKTNSAGTLDEVFELFQEELAKLGYDMVLYSLMSDHNSIGQEAGHGVMRNYPEQWMRYYTEKSYEKIDPVRRLVMQSSLPFRWDDMQNILNLTTQQKRLLNESNEAGLKCGVGLGIHINGESVGLGFASTTGEAIMSQDTLSMIAAITNQFHLAYCNLLKKKNKPDIEKRLNEELTIREYDVLCWMAQGKTKSEIAIIMNISESSVDYYTRRILGKLDANNKTLAVLKAIKFGVLVP